MNENSLSVRQERRILGGILLLGTVLRLAWLGTPSFWLDEVFQVRTAMAPTFMQSMKQVPLNKPYLFYGIEFFVARISVNEWVFRMPSALAGIAAVWVMWVLAKTVFENRHVALCAAGLLAVSPLHIQYSQEARPYALAFLLATAGVWAMFISMKAYGWRGFLAASILPALSGWTLYFGIGLLGLQVLWVGGLFIGGKWLGGSRHSTEVRRAIGRTLVALLISLSLLFPLLLRFFHDSGAKDVPYKGAPMLTLGTMSQIAGWLAFDTKGSSALPIAVAIGCLALTGAIYGLRKRRAATIFLLGWVLVLQGIQIAAFIHQDHWLAARYHLIYVPPMLILASVGCVATLGLVRIKKELVGIGMALTLLALACAAAASVEKWRLRKKPDIREVVRILGERTRPGDIVIGSGYDTVLPYQFYKSQSSVTLPPISDFGNLPDTVANLRHAKRVWLVYHLAVVKNTCSIMRQIDPSLPFEVPDQPVIHLLQHPGFIIDTLAKLEQLQPALRKMEVQLPALLAMKDPEIAGLFGRKWSPPQERNSEIVRWMPNNKGTLAFRLKKGEAPTSLRLKFLAFFRKSRPSPELGIWWNDTLLLVASDLERNTLNTIVTTIPEQAGENGFIVLRITCADNVRAAGYEPPDEPRRLHLAFVELELR